jgi:hypothetical protein
MVKRNVYRIGLVLAAVVLLVSGCCNQPTEYHYPISQNLLNLSPYHAGSIFHLRHSAGAIVRMSVVDESHAETNVGSCGSCCSEEFRDQYFIYFQSDSVSLQFHVQISQDGSQGEYAPTRLELTLNTVGVFYADFGPDAACSAQTGMTCHDTMQVAGRIYKDVFEFQNQSTNQAAGTPDRLYYNGSNGLLKFTTYGGAYWELVF